ncbi:protein slowmo isoform X2 [Ischnura elegans]|uniref:protein slowmo isoform X2 n=1 Tax=Ischnura elegans TaxID=197161 RepID=UPI001ED875D9|nr:protein slowmo isoform X2 [Ischnura elegans]
MALASCANEEQLPKINACGGCRSPEVCCTDEGRLLDYFVGSYRGAPRFLFQTRGTTLLQPLLIGTANVCYASEHSEVDPGSRQMTLKTRNLTFCRYIAWDESLIYSPHPNDPEKTLLKQEAVVTVKGVPLTNYMEDLLTNSISCNAGKGRQAIEWVISKLDSEVKGIASSAARSTDELLMNTRRSIDDITTAAKKSFDDLQNLGTGGGQSLPKF